jgi:purine-nucleoside phosphorylase
MFGMKDATAQRAARKLRELSPLRPKLGIVLGTGFDQTLSDLAGHRRLAYAEIPGFPSVGVTGHAGELVIGRLASVPVVVLRGRAHFYEGHPMETVTFPVRVLAAMGVKDLLLTNAAGGINPSLRGREFMVIGDHINFMGVNPIRGPSKLDRKRFVDLSQVYDPDLRELLLQAGRKCGLHLKVGVYLAVSGPSYETPAEIRAFHRLGADAVGMSTVPEAVAAKQCGLRVAAISCITNAAAGLGKSPLSHRDVLETSVRARETARKLLSQFAVLYGRAAKDSG